MSIWDGMRRVIAAVNLFWCMACGNPGMAPKKFNAIATAAESVRADLSVSYFAAFRYRLGIAFSTPVLRQN
jgi:hypothetical protein